MIHEFEPSFYYGAYVIFEKDVNKDQKNIIDAFIRSNAESIIPEEYRKTVEFIWKESGASGTGSICDFPATFGWKYSPSEKDRVEIYRYLIDHYDNWGSCIEYKMEGNEIHFIENKGSHKNRAKELRKYEGCNPTLIGYSGRIYFESKDGKKSFIIG